MAAAAGDDFDAFERAETAARDGKPLAPATIDTAAPPKGHVPSIRPNKTPEAPKPAAAAAPVEGAEGVETPDNRATRAAKEQQRINDAIRAGISAETATLQAEIAALKAKLGPPAPAGDPPKAQTPVERMKAELAKYEAMPDAPQLEDYDTVPQHAAAMAIFIQEKKAEEGRSSAAAASQLEAGRAQAQARVDAHLTRINKAKEADPDYRAKLSPDVIALKPFGALLQVGDTDPATGQIVTVKEVGTAANFVAEEIMDSEIGDQLLVALSQPGELARITAMPGAIAALADGPQKLQLHMRHMRRLINQLEGRLLAGGSSPAPAAGGPPSPPKPPIAAVPPPPSETISRPGKVTDPRSAAIATSNFTEFDRIEQERERARLAR